MDPRLRASAIVARLLVGYFRGKTNYMSKTLLMFPMSLSLSFSSHWMHGIMGNVNVLSFHRGTKMKRCDDKIDIQQKRISQ